MQAEHLSRIRLGRSCWVALLSWAELFNAHLLVLWVLASSVGNEIQLAYALYCTERERHRYTAIPYAAADYVRTLTCCRRHKNSHQTQDFLDRLYPSVLKDSAAFKARENAKQEASPLLNISKKEPGASPVSYVVPDSTILHQSVVY